MVRRRIVNPVAYEESRDALAGLVSSLDVLSDSWKEHGRKGTDFFEDHVALVALLNLILPVLEYHDLMKDAVTRATKGGNHESR